MLPSFYKFVTENYIHEDPQNTDAPIPPHEQAAKARHPGSAEDSIKRMGSHIDTLTSAIADYQSDRTAFHKVHGKDHPGDNELHKFMKHVLKASHEGIDEPLSLPPSEIDRFRK